MQYHATYSRLSGQLGKCRPITQNHSVLCEALPAMRNFFSYMHSSGDPAAKQQAWRSTSPEILTSVPSGMTRA